jgi:hypothetical protein
LNGSSSLDGKSSHACIYSILSFTYMSLRFHPVDKTSFDS